MSENNLNMVTAVVESRAILSSPKKEYFKFFISV